MHWALIVPFMIQMVAIGVDELHFHRKRGLPRWERIGHPIDTLTLLACLFFTLFVPYSIGALKIYVLLGAFSCLMVTKDEIIHKDVCPHAEHWLHAILFINHPILLTAMGMVWFVTTGTGVPIWLFSCLEHLDALTGFLLVQTLFATFFFLYQVVYWNFIRKAI